MQNDCFNIIIIFCFQRFILRERRLYDDHSYQSLVDFAETTHPQFTEIGIFFQSVKICRFTSYNRARFLACIFWRFEAIHELCFAALGSYLTAINGLPYSCKTLPGALKGCTAFFQRAATLVRLRKGLWNVANGLHITCTAILNHFCGTAQCCSFRTGYHENNAALFSVS